MIKIRNTSNFLKQIDLKIISKRDLQSFATAYYRGMRFLIIILVVFLGCAPKKEVVTEKDLQRFIERFAHDRMFARLDPGPKPKSDYKIFLDTCEIFRLKPKLVMKELETRKPQIYELVKKQNEN